MKKIMILLVAISIVASAEARRGQPRDIPVTIYFHDGAQLEGFLRPFAVDARRVEFRSERGGRVERFESNSIERIRRYDEDGSFGEVVWLPRIWLDRRGNRREWAPVWLNVVIVGHATLFSRGLTYSAMREGESIPIVLAIASENISGSMRHLTLSNVGWKFFEDTYPELAERIRNGEYGNTPADVRAVIHEYNFRAGLR